MKFLNTTIRDGFLCSCFFKDMQVSNIGITYQISFSRGNQVQRTSVIGAADGKELTDLIRGVFKGRFRQPPALSRRDGVRILIKQIDHKNNTATYIMNTMIYNKSVRQARIDMEKAIGG